MKGTWNVLLVYCYAGWLIEGERMYVQFSRWFIQMDIAFWINNPVWRVRQHGLWTVCLAILVVAAMGSLPSSAVAADKLLRQDWWLLESPHFRVITNTREEVPEEIIRDLELFRSVVLMMTGVKQVDEKLPTTAVVFRRMGEFKRLTGRPNIAGYMSATLRGNWMVSGGDSMNMDQRQIMFHEYVHHLLRSASSVNYASWYEEGLADMLSSVYQKDGKVVFGAEVPARMGTLKNNSYQVSLAKVVNNDDLSDWHRYHVSYFYAMSWALVNYLNMGYMLGTENRIPHLNDYLSLLQQGVDREEAFESAFGMTPAQMEGKVNEYLGTKMRPVLMLPRDRFPVVDKIDRRKLTDSEVAHQLAILSTYGNSKLSRKLLVEQLVEDPDNIDLQAALANSYRVEGDLDSAELTARRIVTEHPEDVIASLELARVLTARSQNWCAEGESNCARPLVEAEEVYRRLLTIEPDNPETNAYLASLLLGEQRDLEDAARAVSITLSYQPWSADWNLLAGKIQMQLDRNSEAQSYLQRALTWGSREAVRKEAATLLAELSKRQDKFIVESTGH